MGEHPVVARTRRFYEWEIRGRGWVTYPYPVELEPPFRPFLGHDASELPRIDDGRRETALSRLFKRREPEEERLALPPEPEPLPERFERAGTLREICVQAEAGWKAPDELTARWLSLLGALEEPFSVELVGARGMVGYRLALKAPEDLFAEDALLGLAPGLTTRSAEPLALVWNAAGPYGAVFEFVLRDEFMLPLQAALRDPQTPLLVALAQARDGECAVLQVLSAKACAPWAPSIHRALVTPDGRPFFADAPEVTKLGLEKAAGSLRAVVLRLGVRAGSRDRALALLRASTSALEGFGSGGANALAPVLPDEDADLEADLLRRESHRSGMLVSLAELEALVRLPSGDSYIRGLVREEARTKPAPPPVRGEGVLLGIVEHEDEETPARLATADRLRHMHVVGASGTGKSTLLLSMILQDIDEGHGVALLDPHGDLARDVASRIPEGRLADVVYLDPAADAAIGWNMLAADSESEAELVASDLVGTFRRLATSWGDQMTAVLSNAILAILFSGGGTLLDLRSFLLDVKVREARLSRLADEYLRSFWRREFPLLSSGKSIGPILTRLDTFLRFRMLRRIVAAEKNQVHFAALEERGGIFLANLTEGAIGRENAALLGSLLVSKLSQAAMGRETRRPFFVYLDEFHEVATPSMAGVVTGARKFGLGLVMAHQNLGQLRRAVPEVEEAVLGNAHTRIVFRVGEDDARKLAQGFSFFEADDLGSLAVGEAVCRVGGRENDFRLRTSLPTRTSEDEKREKLQTLQALMRERFPAKEAPAREEPREETEEVPPSPATEERPEVEVPKTRVEAPPPGRGGVEHRYLQELVKRLGEERGFRATIEAQVEGGQVDVALERDDLRIAVEITVTTSAEHEIGNVRKCLAAGFNEVLVVTSRRKLRRELAKLLEDISEEERRRVSILSPEEAAGYLASLPGGEERKVKGYTVRRMFSEGETAEDEARRRQVTRVIAESLERMRREPVSD